MHRLRFLGVVAALVLALAACGDGGEGDGGGGAAGNAPPADADAVVALEDLEFKPEEITVQTGDTVVWEWEEQVLHNVKADEFESDNLSSGTFSHTFAEPGTYDYTCTLHPGMDGTVIVE